MVERNENPVMAVSVPPLMVGLVRVFVVKVCVAPRVTTVSPAAGKANDCDSAPAVNVIVLLTRNVLPSSIVMVDPVAGVVMVTLLYLVATILPLTLRLFAPGSA